ncbi:MAG: DUF1015 domain-containing protein [Methanomassiliicoccales archaeon]
MVDFLPFKGLLPRLSDAESIDQRVAPPYDVISPEELLGLQAKPFNVSRITLGGEGSNYERAARLLREWIKHGKLMKDEEECYYLLTQTFTYQNHKITRTGLMGALRLEPYENGNISPHEETFPKVKEDRLNLLRATSAHLESIFCIYDDMDIRLLDEMKERAERIFTFIDNYGTEHCFSRISDNDMKSTLNAVLKNKKLLIADGHHRYETALRYAQENTDDERKKYLLATLVAGNDPGLAVLPTHRIFRNVQIGVDEFLLRASNFFAVWEARSMDELFRLTANNSRPSLGVVMPGGRMFILELAWRPSEDPLWSIDAYVCEELILKKILEKKGEVKVEYDHDALSAVSKTEQEGVAMAIILSPPRMDLIWEVAKSGQRMPKKSTYFYPKVWSGFVIYDMG